VTAWQAFSVADIAIALTAASAIAAGVVQLTRTPPSRPIAGWATTGSVAAITCVIVLYRLVDPPDDLGLEPGVWLGLIAAVVVLCGSWLAMQDERARPLDRSP
jgi:hypothetical protein